MFLEKGDGKKKSLTDPVDILPFAGQNLRDAAPKPTPKPNIPTSRPPITPPPPKVLRVPTGKLNTQNLSINELYQEQKEKQQSLAPENLPYESFSTDQLKMLWKQFAYKMRDLGKDSVYHALIKRDPVLGEKTTILHEIDNIAQEGALQRVQQELIDFLRENLKNYGIQIDWKLAENIEEDERYLTPKDQFTALARKYPNLHSLRSAFHLDFD